MEVKLNPNHVIALLSAAVVATAIYLGLANGPRDLPAIHQPAPAVPYAPAHTCPTPKPFNVACPYCRNVLSVQPRETGAVVGKAVAGK